MIQRTAETRGTSSRSRAKTMEMSLRSTAQGGRGAGPREKGPQPAGPTDDALFETEIAGSLEFDLPPELEANAPPEARGLSRDEVRLMVSYRTDDRIEHGLFRDIERYLVPGDLLVINTSGTMNAALAARRADGTEIELHLSTLLPDGRWSVELRLPHGFSSRPFLIANSHETLTLPGGGSIHLHEPYSPAASSAGEVRLWMASLRIPEPLDVYLMRYGLPIHYHYVRSSWPSTFYQTIFATDAGSAEMPSAGRGFTPELVTRLVALGIQFAPLRLHTGVASLEDHEPPYAEWYSVPEPTANLVNAARSDRRRVIAVGTTVVRALETVTDIEGATRSGEGWTELVITPERGVRAVDGLLTGLHEPRATHLAMLEALADREHLRSAYSASLAHRYLWHEFGDLHLLLPRPLT